MIGITTAKYSGTTDSGASIEGIGFAIPISDVIDMLEDLRLYGILHRNGNPLDEFVLHCDKKCDESCKLHGRCFLKQVDALADMLDEKMAQIDFDDMANYLRSIL